MKISCLPVSYFPQILAGQLTIAQWAKEAAELGLDAIDLTRLFFENLTDAQISAIRQSIEAAGLRALVLNTYPDFTNPDRHAREAALWLMREDIRKAALLGAAIVRVTAGQVYPETGRQEGIRWVTDGLAALADCAGQHSITLALENHSKPGIWRYYDFAYSTDVFLELAQNLRGTPVRILFDTANTLAFGDDPLPVLEKVYDRVVCLHAADICERGAFCPTVIGKGAAPFGEIFRFLKSAGYAGWLSIEEASQTGSAGVRGAVEFIRQAWAEA